MPIYKVNGDTYNIPEEKQQAFEKKYPDAFISYMNGSDEYEIPVAKRDAFVNKFPEASLKSFSEPSIDNQQDLEEVQQPNLEANLAPVNQSTQKPEQSVQASEFPVFDDEPQAALAPEKVEENSRKLRGLWANVKESSKGIGAGLKGYAGELLNLFTGSSREEQAALNDIEQLEKQGIDVMQYLADNEDAQFQKFYGMSKDKFLSLDKKERKRLVRQASDRMLEQQPFVNPDELREQRRQQANQQAVRDAFNKALQISGGDLTKAKAVLREQLVDKTKGDVLIEEATETMNNLRQPEGFAGWVGNLLPQMIPSAAAIAINYLTKGRASGLSKALGYGTMGGLTLSTAGMSMIEARESGATNLEVWTTGIADGAIEIISEMIPFDRVTKRVFSSAKANVAEKLGDAVLTPKGRKELEKLLSDANEKLGGKLFSKKNVKEWLTDTAYEAAGEFTAEALQTITTMIYENPEDYPTISDVLLAGWEGAKAGLFMGSVTGGASLAASHAMNKERRQTQGYVDVAQIENENGDVEVVEVVGENPEDGTITILHGDSVEDVSRDKIGDRFRFSYEEFENGRLRSREDDAIDNGVVNEGQIRGMEETIQRDLEELQNFFTAEEINQIASGTIPANASAEGVAAARRYMDDVQRIDDLHAAKAEQDQKRKDAVRDRIESEVGQRFWVQEEGEDDGSGVVPMTETVEEVVYADGRVGYVVGSDEAGNLTMVYNDGSRGFSTRAEIAEKESSGEILSNTVMGLDDYLAVKVDIEDVTAEAARMEEEQTANVQSVQAAHPVGSTINVGTAEAKVEVPIIAVNTDGAIVQMPDGTTPQLTWADIAHAEGQEVKPKTNAELDQEVVDEYKVAYQPAVKTGQEPSFTEREVEVEQTTPANPLPLKTDGSVDQTALWNKDPERWAQWNDEQRQDGGANSLAYVNGAIAKEQAKIAELQAAYAAESDFEARDAIEKEIADTQARVERLTAIQQGYVAKVAVATANAAPAESAPAQTASVQPTPVATQQERTTESVLASLNDGTLTEEEIRANIDANLAEAQKAYDKYAKKAPKMGTDKDAYLAEKQKYEQGLPALQQEIDFWNGVKQTYEGAMQQETLPTEESFRPELAEEDMEPHTPQELAARELGLKEGGIKLLWDSVKAHTGFGNGERQKFFGIFRSKDKGGMTIEAAGDRLMEIDREYNLGLFDQSDPMAGVNAILDVLGDAQTIGDLRNYIVNNRAAQVKREAAAAYSAMNAEFEATHGMTMEEWAHANEVQRIEIMSKSALTEAEEYERNVKFAEEEYQYGTNEQSTGTEGLSGGENQGDAGNVEGAADSLYRQGDSILQEAQSDNTGGETVSAGQTEENVSEGDNQDGDTSVHAGEQADEIDDFPDHISEPSLDEDMPDFTSSASAYFQTENIRQRFAVLKDRINEWSSKLGVKVRIMETLDDVVNQSARQQILAGIKVYGFFDVDSGEVAIYLPDFLAFSKEQALSEIDKTYIHEVVSHRGLRGLLGDKKYGELCDKVWKVMTDAQKQRYINYPGVKGNTRAAADEFIAHFAENIDYADNRTLWDKIVDFIKDFLGSIDIPVEISNESMANLLRHSYIKLARDAKATTNANANQQAEGNTVLRAANGSLVGMHNISEEKLRKVIKQGGLANPSTAVVNIAEYLLDGYGEISLIMPSSLVDASTGDNVGTYTGDAWTPTYPPISRKINEKGWKAIKDIVRSVVPEDSPLYYDIINGLENYLEDNRSSKMEFVFLKEKGIEPEIAYKGADGFVGMRNLEAVLGVQGLRDGMESYERYKDASPMAKRSFNMWLDAAGNKQAHKELKEQLKKEPRLADVLKLNEDVSFAAFDSFTYDIFRKEQDAGKIDTYDTMGAAARYVDANNLRGEFEAWLESLMEQAGAKEVFFAGYTRSGERIYKDNTLENVSRHMRLQGRANAYDDHGLSATKAALLQRLTSLSQIRKNKAKLQNEAAYNKEYDTLKDRLFNIISQLADMQEISSNQFMNIDYAESRLQDAISKKNPVAYLNKEYGYEIDPTGEYAEELKSFIKDVQQMPAKYFETKFERPVYLNEFAAAVMPTTTSEDIKQAVSEAGLPIFEYDSEVEGSRKEATLKATEGEGIRFRTARTEEEFNATQQEAVREKGIIAPGLWETSVNVVEVPKHDFTGRGIDAIHKAEKWALEHIVKEHIYHDGQEDQFRYLIDEDTVGKFLSKSSTGASDNLGVHLAALKMLPQIIDNSIDVEIHPDYRKVGGARLADNGVKDEGLLVHRMYGAINIDGKIYRTKTTIHEFRDKINEAYDYKITEIELIVSGSSSSNARTNPTSVSAAKVLKGVEKSYDKGVKVLDVEYLKAVEAGDMETAQRMVNEAAKLAGYDSNSDYQGSLAFNGAAPSGYAYYDTKEERIEAWESGEYEDDQTLGDYKDAGIDISNLGWSLTSPVAQRMGNEYTRESIKNLADAVNSDSRKIKVYRAVDANIKEDSVRNGDWVTPSRAYAEHHIDLQNWGSGRVIEQEVDIDNIWWDGNDINEWGYNDGKGYAYKNTPNNRKLLAPVTYDDNGNVIPLSERFNPENEDIRFRMSNENQAIFVSNAAKAVEGIKMEKATPEQWLKMIEKNGGLKAGEDKWMGLSDWLKASDKKTLTKQEVLDFVNEHMIVIEEEKYGEVELSALQDEFNEIYDNIIDNVGNEDKSNLQLWEVVMNPMERAWEELRDRYSGGDDFDMAFSYDSHGNIEINDPDAAGYFLGVKPINDTRLDYTTSGLQNKQEIALVIPAIEPWNERDDIHFGDAGDGRAVAWIRFGETYTEDTNSDVNEHLKEKYSKEDFEAGNFTEEDWDKLRGARKQGKKVLVIDEIQSKRHQEGREKGYKSDFKNSKEAQRLKAEVDRVTARLMELVNDRRENEESELTELARLDIALDNAVSNAEYDAILEEQEKIRAHRENREAEELAVRGERRELAYLLDKQIDRDAVSAISAVPDAPFDKNWHELAMKRMLRYAAENGYDVVAWTTGDQQADRYNLGKIYNEIEREDNPNIEGRTFSFSGGNYDKVTVNEDGVVVDSTIEEAKGKSLSDLVGKDLAVKMMSLENYDTIDEEDLRIGGEGMKGFYDKMLPAFMNKYGKKWGVKVEDIDLPNLGKSGRTMHSVPVTEEMKASVMEGQVMFRTTAITQEVQDEMDAISATAIVRGNYLKAPNGADTNLTPEQWAMVRTKNFKQWFGDWINDPANASKVVDANGEPKVVFHGSPNEFNAFDEDMIGENTDSGFYGRGFYFATTEEESRGYGEYVIPAFLSMQNPLDLNELYAISEKWDGATADGAVRWWYGLASMFPNDAISKTVYASIGGEDWTIMDLKNRIDELAETSETPFADAAEEFGIDEDFFDMMGEEDVNLPDELTDALKANGYDGVINAGVENNELVALYPNQIKSATDNTGEFSEGEGDIRFRVADSESKREIINNTEPVDVIKGAIVATDGESVSKAALRWFEENVGKELTYNTEVGTVTINRRSVKNSLAHGYSQTKLDAITSLPEGFGRAVYLASEDDFDGKPEVNHYFVYPINYDGSIHYVLCRVKSDVNKSSLYIHEVFPIDAIKGHTLQTAADQSQPHRGISLYLDLLKEVLYGKDTDNLETTNDSDENISLRVTGTPTDELVTNGLQLTPAQTAEVAANIFAALPEESRKKITEGLNGDILGLKDAILQIPTSLASKESWNDEDRAMADIVAEEMTKMAGEMTRPFSAEEGLWLLYNNLNKGNDLISQASRALVQRNLGFDAETLAKQEQAKEDVRFRTVGDATSNAQASLYNRGAVNVWTRLKESFVDMQASVEELVKAIEKRTGKVAQGFENILLALNQQSSKGLAAMESYIQKFLNPMLDEIRRIMDETKMKYEDVVRYVILKHGLERNKKLAQRDARAHYQEIYDDIISKITGMTAAQKRTYLTNAQLKEGDAKAELATLQAVDMSAMTDEEKREHKKKLAAARKAVEEAEEYLKRAQKIASMSEQEAQDELDMIFEKIENETDSVYKEMRENDYSGISSMFYDQLGVDRKKYTTEEEYQAALMQAKADKYDTLGDIEGAAQMEVDLFEKAVKTENLWKRINAATKETLRQQYEANMISKDQYLNLRDMFEYYVPLRGFKDNTAEDMYTYYRKPNSTGYTKPILGAEGRKTEAESPFGWIAAMAGSAIASNVKNEAKLALYYFVSNRPENGIATISRTWFIDSGEVDERGKKIFKPAYPPFSEDLSSDAAKANYEAWQENMRELQKKGQAYEAGQRLNLGNAVVNISDANKPEHIVNVKVGGKDYTIIINGNPRAAQAINGDLNIEGTAQDYSALFGPVLRWMSSVNTSYNPEFWITNMMRDMAFTMMAVNVKEDPAYRRKFSKNYRKAFKVISLVAKNEKGTIGDSYLEQQYKDFVKYGGVTGYTQIKDSETWEKEIENYLSSNDPKSVKNGKFMRGMKSAFHAAHRFGESLEQVSRFAAFLTARETGKSINEAINDAKEITVNFNRKGSGKMITLEEAKYLTGKNGQPLTKPQQWMVVGLSSIAPLGRRFIMFFNAAIQGLNATYKLMKKNPKRFTGWALGYAAVGMLNAVLHAMLDDDDDYLDIPQYERRNSLMIGGNGAYFKWALPQEARAFYALGDLAVETVMGRNPHQNVLGEALKIGTEILPVNPSEGWKAFMPSVAIPFVELALNEDYKGAPIYNEQKWLSKEEKERTAKWSNAYQGTGWTYVKIAQGLNFISGGDKHDAGLINLQPEKLEHLVQSAFGGTIRTADKFINTISAAIDPEEPNTVRQAPFLNRFLTINDERFKNVHVNDVFDYYKADAEHALTLEKQYIKDRDMASLTELRSSDEYQWAKIYSKYKKSLKAIQDKIKVADGTAEKKELMKQQDELKKRMIKEISEL